MPKPNRKPALSVVASNNGPDFELQFLARSTEGPLAEAEALAEALMIEAVRNSMSRDGMAALSIMLSRSLHRLRGVIEDHLASTGGAR